MIKETNAPHEEKEDIYVEAEKVLLSYPTEEYINTHQPVQNLTEKEIYCEDLDGWEYNNE